jgi:hypothetical protein
MTVTRPAVVTRVSGCDCLRVHSPRVCVVAGVILSGAVAVLSGAVAVLAEAGTFPCAGHHHVYSWLAYLSNLEWSTYKFYWLKANTEFTKIFMKDLVVYAVWELLSTSLTVRGSIWSPSVE